MKEVLFYFALFFIYSFIGWLIEMFCVNVILKQKFANRGFLIGPYCPIYGSASLIMIFLLSRYKEDILVLFFMSIIICSITEYLTSYIMEKIFKARWWDYTNEPFNLNGRICLINSIAFGMLGVLLIKFINPFFSNLLLKINPLIFNIISCTLFVLFILDVILSCNIIKKIKISASNLRKDSTNEVSKKVKSEIMSKGYFFRRIVKAFPDLRFDLFKKSKK